MNYNNNILKNKKLNQIFKHWLFFSYTKRKIGEKIMVFFGVFWCGIMNIYTKKTLFHDASNKLGKKIHSNLHKCIRI